MTTITFRSPVLEPLHREGWSRPSSGAGADDFRVTQQFGDPDYYWSNVPNPPNPLPTHRATDIGNGRCGYPLVAMAAGLVTRIHDNAKMYGAPEDALGVRIDHGHGVVTEVWHCSGYAADVPSGTLVGAGRVIAYVGKTGLGQVCHAHVTCRVNGVLVDPEPLMFGGSITIEEDDEEMMRLYSYGHLHNRQGNLTADAWLRETPHVTDATRIKVFPAGTAVVPFGKCRGQKLGDNEAWHPVVLWVDETHDGRKVNTWVMGFIHSSLIGGLEAIEEAATNCAPQINAAVTEERERWSRWVGTAPD